MLGLVKLMGVILENSKLLTVGLTIEEEKIIKGGDY